MKIELEKTKHDFLPYFNVIWIIGLGFMINVWVGTIILCLLILAYLNSEER